jgi:hypothetical protein
MEVLDCLHDCVRGYATRLFKADTRTRKRGNFLCAAKEKYQKE